MVPDEHLGRYDQKRLPGRSSESLRSSSESVSYGLKHSDDWVCAPRGQAKGHIIPKELTFCNDAKKAWVADTMDLAIERSRLLLNGWGYHTEVRVLRTK